MGDRLTKQERSDHMRRIRKTDTKPELIVCSAAHRLGYRFRLHRRDLPGTPDLVFPRLHKIIFVHGCFWHQHSGCRLDRLPQSRPEYWLPKLARNRERDEEAVSALTAGGWSVLVIWECEVADLATVRSRIDRFLAGRL